jgi:hypothetical protein
MKKYDSPVAMGHPLPFGGDKELYYKIFSNYKENLETQCWEWQGRLNEKGYGLIDIENEPHRVHRVAFRLHHGFLNPKLLICHHCDNPKCINPKHLFEGTAWDNTVDMINKGRAAWQK